jgi:hypothetical protein
MKFESNPSGRMNLVIRSAGIILALLIITTGQASGEGEEAVPGPVRFEIAIPRYPVISR